MEKNNEIRSIGSRYRVDTAKRKRMGEPMFHIKKVSIVVVDDDEVDKFFKRNKRLPDHVYRVKGGK